MINSKILGACTGVCILLSLTVSIRSQTTGAFESTLPLHTPSTLDNPPACDPLTYKSGVSGTIFYVESDGRHLSAIDKDGKLLWCTDLSIEMARSPFHLQRALRLSEWNPPGRWLSVHFGNTDEMQIDVVTGKILGMIHD